MDQRRAAFFMTLNCKILYAKITGLSATLQAQQQQIDDLKKKNLQIKQWACAKDPQAPFCQ